MKLATPTVPSFNCARPANNVLKNGLLALPGASLTTYPYKLLRPIFSPAPTARPGYAYVMVMMMIMIMNYGE